MKHLRRSCSKCRRNTPREGQRYCVHCHNAYCRTHRRRHRDLTPEQRRRANARSYANVYKRRGNLRPQPCEECGADRAQMHHPDYSKPLSVVWLCRPCHLEHHLYERAAA